ncbi:MAG TPA: hypothetical protein DCY33_03520 [Gemmatimonadetes bacterium]|nr:hypothetical protein [Gemmatimonadaceae bacterium]HAY76888.1 hypothetical protein [Gemmatimonadota bacterium]
MRKLLPREAVVQLGERDESPVHRKIVSRIRSLQPEPAVKIQNQASGMTVGERPVESYRSSQHQGHAGSFLVWAERRGSQPQTNSRDGLDVRRPKVLPSGHRDAQVMERPSTDAKVDTSSVPEKLESQRDGADSTSGDPYAHSIASTRSLPRQRCRERDANYGDGDGVSAHGLTLACLLVSLGVKRTKRYPDKRRIIEPRALWVHGIWRAVLVAGAISFTACAAPDRPNRIDHTLPNALLEWLEPDSVRKVVLHPGVIYGYLWSPKGPWAIHIVRVSTGNRCDLGFKVLQAEHAEDGSGGRKTVSSMVAGAEHNVLAAINADFFTPAGNPLGVEVVDGEIRETAARPTFAWKPGMDPWIGVSQAAEDELLLGWSVSLGEGDGETQALGGFPVLIDGGQRVGDLEVQARPSFAAARHPRSAIGYNTRTGQVWIVLVDGRQEPHSAGMTLPEIARLFESAGIDQALNLDGGGSSALVLGHSHVNRPSDATGERPVVNALALITDSTWCEAN